jgi:hypothetical protein
MRDARTANRKGAGVQKLHRASKRQIPKYKTPKDPGGFNTPQHCRRVGNKSRKIFMQRFFSDEKLDVPGGRGGDWRIGEGMKMRIPFQKWSLTPEESLRNANYKISICTAQTFYIEGNPIFQEFQEFQAGRTCTR